jgi:hypothetical protein
MYPQSKYSHQKEYNFITRYVIVLCFMQRDFMFSLFNQNNEDMIHYLSTIKGSLFISLSLSLSFFHLVYYGLQKTNLSTLSPNGNSYLIL